MIMARTIIALLRSIAWDNKVQYIQQHREARLRVRTFCIIIEELQGWRAYHFTFGDSFGIIIREPITNTYLLFYIRYYHPPPQQSNCQISINKMSTPIRRNQEITEIEDFEPVTINIQLTYLWEWIGLWNRWQNFFVYIIHFLRCSKIFMTISS